MPSIRTAAARAAAVACAVAAPALLQAQFTRTFSLCNDPQQFCAGVGLALAGNTLTVGLANVGSAPSADSFLSGFGLFGGGITGGTLVTAGNNAPRFVTPDGSRGLAFATNGAPRDLQRGAGTQATALGVDFGNGGLRPCGFGDQTGGSVRFETCAGEYALFTFHVAGSSVRLADVGFAVRAQNLQPVNGATQTSDKCFSRGDANCRLGSTAAFGGTPTAVVPEPATAALVGAGLLGFVCSAWRRRR